MHLEVIGGAVSKELGAARPEVGQAGEELLGGRSGCLVKVDRDHGVLLDRDGLDGRGSPSQSQSERKVAPVKMLVRTRSAQTRVSGNQPRTRQSIGAPRWPHH